MELLKFINQGVSKDKRQVVTAILDELMEQMAVDDIGDIRYETFIRKVTNDDEVWQLFRALSPFTRLIQQREAEALK